MSFSVAGEGSPTRCVGDRPDGASRESIRFAAVALSSWALQALCWIAPTYWVERSHHAPHAPTPSVSHVLIELMCMYVPWPALTALVWRLGRKYPFVTGRIAKSAVVHLIVTFVSVPLVIWTGRLLARAAFSLAGAPITLVPIAGALLISSFSMPTYVALIALGQEKCFPFTISRDHHSDEPPSTEAGPYILHSISVRERGRTVIVKLADVDFIDMADHYLCFHSGTKVHLLRGTLRDLEERLDPARFLRVHRSTIVQLDRITAITERSNGDCMLVLEGGIEVAASRSYRKEIASRLRLRNEFARPTLQDSSAPPGAKG